MKTDNNTFGRVHVYGGCIFNVIQVSFRLLNKAKKELVY